MLFVARKTDGKNVDAAAAADDDDDADDDDGIDI